MLTSPPEIFPKLAELKRLDAEFVLASVIAVRGAASAKTGSKAIFDSAGKNILGWVGGGCAEAFLAREALEALKARTPRTVTVDLDDEVFGLMPCGGVMDVYLEPHFPAETLVLPACGSWNDSAAQFVRQLGYECSFHSTDDSVQSWAEVFRLTAKALARKFDRPLRPWRETKGMEFAIPQVASGRPLVILGQTRITEELSRLALLLKWPTTIYAQQPRAEQFPQWTSVCELPLDFDSVTLEPHSLVVVASHHQLDHKFIAHALKSQADYVALVASEKRSRLVGEELTRESQTLDRFFAPAGLSLRSDTPTQIAFSICCEILFLQDGSELWI